MLVSTIFASVAILATGVQSAFIPRNKHVADFRLFGGEDCANPNLGIWTVIDTDFQNYECKSLNDDTVKSVLGVSETRGCKLYVFSDAACRVGREEVKKGGCQSVPAGFKAWSMVCN
ncbi:hypothetical protein HIM_05681 [Hirsutella minnesotensis 3608]|uniref:Ecp2 effector protein domain-containing protein n=1 Tax=Hirsutella minnesotensis 3608 TaxID=1043627 RepID=A0A0F7ZP63_9HYPO|nr:hypothetical protein HIM_05681 [Hirsutella minnesotensis 3608]